MRDLVIVGCGGFGREVVDVVDAINAVTPTWQLLGFLDDAPSDDDRARVERIGLRLLGPVEPSALPAGASFVIGIGSGRVRQLLARRLGAREGDLAVLVDPRASVGRGTIVGAGSVLAAGAHVTTNVVLGEHVHVDRGAQVGHDSTLADFVTVHPSATVSGGCDLRERSRLGTHSVVLPGVTVGADALVGAGACVVRDVPAGAVVKGVPAQ